MKKTILKFWNRLLGNNIPTITIQLEERDVSIHNKEPDSNPLLKEIKEDMEKLKSHLEGKVTKSKLNKLTKKQIIEEAKVKFNTKLDAKLTKSNLVNKLYTLYNSQK